MLAPASFINGRWECRWPKDLSSEEAWDNDVTDWKTSKEVVRIDGNAEMQLTVYHDPDTPGLGFIRMLEAWEK